MMIRDLQHARECARALASFFEDLRNDEDAGEEGMNADELCKSHTFARALDAALDDTFRRTQRGFTLVEVMISMLIAGTIAMMLAQMLVLTGRHATLITRQLELGQQARSRVEKTVMHVCTPEAGVTVTWGDVDPVTGLALAHVETSYLANTLSTDVARAPCAE